MWDKKLFTIVPTEKLPIITVLNGNACTMSGLYCYGNKYSSRCFFPNFVASSNSSNLDNFWFLKSNPLR